MEVVMLQYHKHIREIIQGNVLLLFPYGTG